MNEDEVNELVFQKLCEFFETVLLEADEKQSELTAYCMMFVSAHYIYEKNGIEHGDEFIKELLETLKNAGTNQEDWGSPDVG